MSSLGSYSQNKKVRFWLFLVILAFVVSFKVSSQNSFIGLSIQPNEARAVDNRNDLNDDGVIDMLDLEIWSWKYLQQPWQDIDWCSWLDANHREIKFMGSLLEAFVRDHFKCDEANEPPQDPLAIVNKNKYPMRLALGPNGNVYVSDPKIGSVFIYDVNDDVNDANFTMIGELKGLNKPLGIAVDQFGNIYVGNSGKGSLEIYDANGVKVKVIGRGLIKMPNDLALDLDGRVYVADSKNDTIWVFDANGGVVRSIGTPGDGQGQFKFPITLTIAYYTDDQTGQDIGELYVGDQGHSLVHVFSLDGTFLRSFGAMVKKSLWGGWKWQGRFASLQSLAIDSDGYLHALDCYLDKVQLFDPETGSYQSLYYGESGTAPGQLNLPMDIVVNDLGQVILAEARNGRIEIIFP
ncbi:MAG: NHL repeat-containing protein [Planctomycetota bacterium]|jgi:DNA-binding beta-propeller fold protein YncE